MAHLYTHRLSSAMKGTQMRHIWISASVESEKWCIQQEGGVCLKPPNQTHPFLLVIIIIKHHTHTRCCSSRQTLLVLSSSSTSEGERRLILLRPSHSDFTISHIRVLWMDCVKSIWCCEIENFSSSSPIFLSGRSYNTSEGNEETC